MPETLADPQVDTDSVKCDGRPIIWWARVHVDPDEINPDTLTTVCGLLIGSLEGEVEDAQAAASWESLQINQHHNIRLIRPEGSWTGTIIEASVRAL